MVKLSLELWIYLLISKAHKMYGVQFWGGNAYVYKTSNGFLCCAVLYARQDSEWIEIAAAHGFTLIQLPREIRESFCEDKNIVDATNVLKQLLSEYNKNGDDTMKFNLFKLAQVAQTAINVADNVNATYNIPHTDNDDLSAYAQNTSMSGTGRGMSMVRAAVNQDWFDLAKLGFDALVNLVSEDPLSYDNFLSAISQYIDVKIQQFSQEENLRFVGGECALSVVREEKVVKSKAQMYFKNASGKWIVKELIGNTTFNCFTAETLDGELTDIMNSGGVKFPITKPE